MSDLVEVEEFEPKTQVCPKLTLQSRVNRVVLNRDSGLN